MQFIRSFTFVVGFDVCFWIGSAAHGRRSKTWHLKPFAEGLQVSDRSAKTNCTVQPARQSISVFAPGRVSFFSFESIFMYLGGSRRFFTHAATQQVPVCVKALSAFYFGWNEEKMVA